MLKLTGEQEAAVSAFSSRHSFKIQALAGTGKTSTLISMAQSSQHLKGHYLAFNQAIAADAARRFGRSVTCGTTHSLAFRTLVSAGLYSTERMLRTPNIKAFEEEVGTMRTPLPISKAPSGTLELAPRAFASLVMSSFNRFLRSSDENLQSAHIKECIGRFELTDADRVAVAQTLLPAFNHIRSITFNVNSAFPIGHDGYLKAYALAQPRLDGDYILLDEAQDTSDAVLGLLSAQASQVIYVGDEHQQIYHWRGAVNALNKVNCSKMATLTTSFRFGDAIAEIASRVLSILGCILRLVS